MNDFNFAGIDDVLGEKTGWGDKGLWYAIKIVFAIASGATTFLFFSGYSGGIFTDVVGADLSPWAAGIMGVIMFDLAAQI